MEQITEQRTSETEDEKRRRLQRERTKRSRDKKKYGPASASEEISANWERNSRQLQDENPGLYAELQARHDEVEALEAEADEVDDGIAKGLRAGIRTLATADGTDIFPMPDLSFRDLKLDIQRRGCCNYGEIESRVCVESKSATSRDAEAQHYLRYGFLLRHEYGTLQRARENLVIYALRTKDANLNWTIVEDAISDCLAYQGFSPHPHLKTQIQKYQQENKHERI
jgi:hypothetical protein